MLCSSKSFLRGKTNSHFCLDIVPKRTQEMEKMDFISTKILQLLKESKEIVSNDLPIGLPPLRSVAQRIELIPRSIFPNKKPYKMTLVESEEVNRQV
jgi:hypothetical protein